jgi:hypothetical protein
MNASFTTLQIRAEEIRLFRLNNALTFWSTARIHRGQAIGSPSDEDRPRHRSNSGMISGNFGKGISPSLS